MKEIKEVYLFLSFLKVVFFTILDNEVQNSASQPLWSQQGRVHSMKRWQSLSSTVQWIPLSSYINGSMFLNTDSTTVFANEIRPLNFTVHWPWLLQIGADWKLPISDQTIGHPTPRPLSNLVSLRIYVSGHGSRLGAPESLSCFPSCWEMSYLSDLFSLVKPPIENQDILFFWHVLLYWKCWLLRIKTAGAF